MSIHRKASSTNTVISIFRVETIGHPLPHSDMVTSQPSLMNSGKLEAVHAAHRNAGAMNTSNNTLFKLRFGSGETWPTVVE